LSNSYSTGAVTSTGGSVGGFGNYNGGSNPINSLFDATTATKTDTQVAGPTTTNMQFEATFFNWNFDFTNVWTGALPVASGYPILQWQNPTMAPPSSSDFAGGNGSLTTPFLISTVDQFNNMSRNSSYSNSGVYFQLNANLDFTGKAIAWVGVNNAFQGHFDGGASSGYSISNINIPIDESLGRNNVGVFSQINGGTVQNLILNNIVINATTSSYVGGVVGYLYAGTVNQVCVMGTSSINGAAYVGGVAGYARPTSVAASLTQSCSLASVSGTGQGVGGFIGFTSNAGPLTIANDYAQGSVTGSGSCNGGFVGYSSWPVSSSYATGAVGGTGSSFGGFAGCYNGGGASNNLFDSSTTGRTDSYAAGLITSDLTYEASFFNWNFDFTNIWTGAQPVTSGYPILQWQNPSIVPSSTTDFASGSGTFASPYLINTVDQFNNISRSPSSTYNSATTYFKLTSNIDFTGKVIAWVGANNVFQGSFDGNSETISNVTITSSQASGRNNVGVFSQISGATATVKNLTLNNISINAPSANDVGPVVGYLYAGTINKVAVTGTSSVTGANDVGGFAGYVRPSSNSATISQCSTVATVSGISSVGGFIGFSSNAAPINITNSYARGNVTGTGNSIGGFVGYDSCSISNCYSTGVVTGSGSGVQGFGGSYNGVSPSNCVFDSVAGKTDSVATSYSTSSMDGTAPYNGTWLSTIWNIGGGYPTLK
jgi:hypothetical protein